MPVFTGDAQESGIRVQEICCFGLESIHLKVFDYIRSNKQNEVKKTKSVEQFKTYLFHARFTRNDLRHLRDD